MPKVSDHFVVGVNAPPRWTVDIVGNVEWREDTTNLDTLSTLKSIAPEFAIPSVLDDRITPISIREGHRCKVRVRYFTPTQLRNNWRLVTPRDTKPSGKFLGKFSEWMDAVVEKVLLSTTIVAVEGNALMCPQNGAVLRTYIVLAHRLGDQKRMRMQVVPYVGELMVPGFIPFPIDTYKARSEHMTSVYVGLPVIAESEDERVGRKWYTVWYRARLDVVNTLEKNSALTVIDGPYAEEPPFKFTVESDGPLLPGSSTVRDALLERRYQVGGTEEPGMTYHRLDLEKFDGVFPITYVP
ncbi:hypothetical protein C8Q72DRAFT_796591 [Fomitopsis betulina]|nr:hypothetical protein C8Q72DRAFT_796591 [Fomitopsis betulina]